MFDFVTGFFLLLEMAFFVLFPHLSFSTFESFSIGKLYYRQHRFSLDFSIDNGAKTKKSKRTTVLILPCKYTVYVRTPIISVEHIYEMIDTFTLQIHLKCRFFFSVKRNRTIKTKAWCEITWKSSPSKLLKAVHTHRLTHPHSN